MVSTKTYGDLKPGALEMYLSEQEFKNVLLKLKNVAKQLWLAEMESCYLDVDHG